MLLYLPEVNTNQWAERELKSHGTNCDNIHISGCWGKDYVYPDYCTQSCYARKQRLLTHHEHLNSGRPFCVSQRRHWQVLVALWGLKLCGCGGVNDRAEGHLSATPTWGGEKNSLARLTTGEGNIEEREEVITSTDAFRHALNSGNLPEIFCVCCIWEGKCPTCECKANIMKVHQSKTWREATLEFSSPQEANRYIHLLSRTDWKWMGGEGLPFVTGPSLAPDILLNFSSQRVKCPENCLEYSKRISGKFPANHWACCRLNTLKIQ